MADWEAKGYLKLDPEKLKWTPFILSKNDETLAERDFPLATPITADRSDKMDNPFLVDGLEGFRNSNADFSLSGVPTLSTPPPGRNLKPVSPTPETRAPMNSLDALAEVALAFASDQSSKELINDTKILTLREPDTPQVPSRKGEDAPMDSIDNDSESSHRIIRKKSRSKQDTSNADEQAEELPESPLQVTRPSLNGHATRRRLRSGKEDSSTSSVNGVSKEVESETAVQHDAELAAMLAREEEETALRRRSRRLTSNTISVNADHPPLSASKSTTLSTTNRKKRVPESPAQDSLPSPLLSPDRTTTRRQAQVAAESARPNTRSRQQPLNGGGRGSLNSPGGIDRATRAARPLQSDHRATSRLNGANLKLDHAVRSSRKRKPVRTEEENGEPSDAENEHQPSSFAKSGQPDPPPSSTECNDVDADADADAEGEDDDETGEPGLEAEDMVLPMNGHANGDVRLVPDQKEMVPISGQANGTVQKTSESVQYDTAVPPQDGDDLDLDAEGEPDEDAEGEPDPDTMDYSVPV